LEGLMPALNERDYAEFSRLLDELRPEVDNLRETPQSFVKDMLNKRDQYGERMFVSPKQKAWIEQLHEECVGNTAFDHDED
jgi:hypothetical protein